MTSTSFNVGMSMDRSSSKISIPGTSNGGEHCADSDVKMEDDPIRNWHGPSADVYADDGGASHTGKQTRSLLQLSLDCIVKKLWLSEMSNWFETRVLNCERVVNKLHQNCDSITSSLPSLIKKMLIDNIFVVGMQINEKFSDLNGLGLFASLFNSRVWRDFAPVIWDFVKENDVNYFIVEKIFKNIVEEMNSNLHTISSDEVSFYLRVWRSFPKDLRSRVVVSLSYYKTISTPSLLKHFPRDLRFFAELLIDFDAEERKKIWLENYEQLIVGANPLDLEHLMKLCFDNDEEQIIEFKRQYFVKSGHADRYCLDLIVWGCFVEADKFLIFCSSNQLEAEELTKRILRKHIASHTIAEEYPVLFKILRSNTELICRVIKMAEFQYLFQMQTEYLKTFSFYLINRAEYKQLIEFLKFSLPPEQNMSCFVQDVVKSFFTDRVIIRNSTSWLLMTSSSDDFTDLNNLNNLIENSFVTSEAAARFKKEIMFSKDVLDLMRCIMLSYEEPFRHLRDDRMRCVEKFLALFLSSEQDLSEWKDAFVADSIKCMRLRNENSFSLAFLEWEEVYKWFFDSDEKVSQFKASLSMDEILSIYIDWTFADTWYFDHILQWYYSSNEEQIVFFKMQKLSECRGDQNSDVRLILLGDAENEFDRCTNDHDRFEVLRQALGQVGQEERPLT